MSTVTSPLIAAVQQPRRWVTPCGAPAHAPHDELVGQLVGHPAGGVFPKVQATDLDVLSALGGTRTPNLLIRSQMLYPIELQAPATTSDGPARPEPGTAGHPTRASGGHHLGPSRSGGQEAAPVPKRSSAARLAAVPRSSTNASSSRCRAAATSGF